MLCDCSEDLFQNGIGLGNLWSTGLNVEGYCTWFGYKSLEDEPHHQDAEGQGEGEVEVLRLREGGLLRVLQVRPGDIVREPEPLVPEPGLLCCPAGPAVSPSMCNKKYWISDSEAISPMLHTVCSRRKE